MSRSINNGENNGSAKLSLEDVKLIRFLLSEGRMLQKDIAHTFRVSKATISMIKRGHMWVGPEDKLKDKWL